MKNIKELQKEISRQQDIIDNYKNSILNCNRRLIAIKEEIDHQTKDTITISEYDYMVISDTLMSRLSGSKVEYRKLDIELVAKRLADKHGVYQRSLPEFDAKAVEEPVETEHPLDA